MSSPVTAPPGFNFAHFAGIHSVAAAVIFAVLYVPLFGFYVYRSIRRPTYVFIVLALFCIIRVTAFVLRAILAGKESAGENLHLLIGEQVLYSVGFFGLIYSAYTLVLDRIIIADPSPPSGLINRLTRNRHLFRIALTAAVAVGITGTTDANLSSNPSTISLGNNLRKASVIIFLVLTVLLLLQTFLLVRAELSTTAAEKSANDHVHDRTTIGGKHGIYILCLIAILLLVREAFLTATVSNLKAQGNEKLFYPLAALPELLAVCLFAAHGLVPSRGELPK